ncbi:tRNA (adenosine(37)-N6)-threonylcarbamoyltransferase complex dimerization subunit type 1 TsaB [Acinetobacter sp. MD2]|uniref:tRNA (adenosine(37)-N6)-threonylcarbamoyltransferase complex dimerization subunit type 1 TsaB n=1 Tax=Acinetobacter sp. MD2 TaxID=2600066 RepID=UPI002D1EBED6|nr:tRNA (adenosine(37)-N6)-threonylcarbamoyltransferase complex dimerization subunit type 1 TsaB [Acinetobacter sp. MD2]MEB3768095.1 tRNA (adenosine(37)-N6)-threonylcarbamoyltransferase complex dimerization subunit type 1 TsaB [Acinetobacter sp. MD2]
MKLLALETANEQCSVCLVNDTNTVFFALNDQPRAQTKTILPMIEQGLQQNAWATDGLDVIAFSRGPGSFSGVRINAAVTQALAWANDLPVIAVSTLQALAQAAYREHQLKQVTAVFDARMQEVYIANFVLDEQGIMQAVSEEKMLSYAKAQAEIQYEVVGSGAHLLQQDTRFGTVTPNAQDIATIAISLAQKQQWVDAAHALPVYLRDNAWKKIPEQGKP